MSNLLQLTIMKADCDLFINPCSICLIGYLTNFPVKVSILAPVPERLHCDIQFLSDFSIFFWFYGQHKCCSATSRSPLKTSHVYSTSPTGSRNHLASFRFQNTFRLNV